MDEVPESVEDQILRELILVREDLKASKTVMRRLWVAVVIGAVVIVLLIAGGVGLGVVTARTNTALRAANDAIEQGCENANVSRAGQRRIWLEYFKVTLASNQAQGAPEPITEYIIDLRDWIVEGVLFDSDCTDPHYVRPDYPKPPSFQKVLESIQDE